MFIPDLFLEMRDLCRTCSDDDRASEYQTLDLMVDSATIAHMEKGERLYWFAHENGTHFNHFLQVLDRLQEFYTEETFARAITPIYVVDCVSGDNYEFYPLADLYN